VMLGSDENAKSAYALFIISFNVPSCCFLTQKESCIGRYSYVLLIAQLNNIDYNAP
jgi:hypothetical protein